MKKSILTVIGTRPEAIKLAPVLHALKQKNCFESCVCVTRQHTDLLEPHLDQLGLAVDYYLEKSKKESLLHQSAAHFLQQLGNFITQTKPSLVLVQGDTTTAFTAALAAYYACIPVAHLEAGLRTGNPHSPWPEETHRTLITRMAHYFFAPTKRAEELLLSEGIAQKRIWMIGNTSIDAVRLARQLNPVSHSIINRSIVVTMHRRENQGESLINICKALCSIVEQYSDVTINFVLHANPNVRKTVLKLLSERPRVTLHEPLGHAAFINLLDASLFIVTDSGGIQEEASFLGKPLLIVRDTTERPEGISEGTAKLIGTNASALIENCRELLESSEKRSAMSKVHFPYGDGYAANRLVDILEKELCS